MIQRSRFTISSGAMELGSSSETVGHREGPACLPMVGGAVTRTRVGQRSLKCLAWIVSGVVDGVYGFQELVVMKSF